MEGHEAQGRLLKEIKLDGADDGRSKRYYRGYPIFCRGL